MIIISIIIIIMIFFVRFDLFVYQIDEVIVDIDNAAEGCRMKTDKLNIGFDF